MASAAVWRKRSFDESSNYEDSPREQKRPRHSYYYRLESESSISQENSDTESIYSIQDKVTDCAKDTSDTDSKSEDGYDDVEYELASLPTEDERDSCFMFYKSSSEENLALYVAAVVGDSEALASDTTITDSEDSDSCPGDTSCERTDFGICLQCKSKHKNPQFRFCEQCFQSCRQCEVRKTYKCFQLCAFCYKDRKAFFPPRPKGFRKARPKRKSSPPAKSKTRKGSSGLHDSGLASQDSGTGSQDWAQSSGSSSQVSGLSSHESGISSQESGISLNDIPTCSQVSALLSQESEISSQESGIGSQESGIGSQDFVLSSQEAAPLDRLKSTHSNDDDQRPSTSKGLDSSNRKRKLSESSISEREEMPRSKKKSRTKNEDLVKMLREDAQTERSLEDENEGNQMPELKEKCVICNIKPKNAIFLHGSIAHMCSCYRCAMKTWKITKKCPICNRGISNVVKVFTT